VSEFPLTVENGEVKNIFLRIPDTFQFRTVRPGDKAWVIMFNECLIHYPDNEDDDFCGEALNDFCAHWHHDGGSTGVSAIRTVCDPKGLGNRTPSFEDTSAQWAINNAGPTYSHSFFDQFSHIIEASDQESIDRYGEVDSFIDFSFLTDENSMNQMLSSVLQFAAKPRRIYEMTEIF